MRVALRRPDGHCGERRDLLEGEVETVLQHDDLRLGGSDPRELAAELAPEIRTGGRGRRVAVSRDTQILDERLAAADALAVGDVAARVHDQPVQPCREQRIAAKLLDANADLGERLLGGVTRILAVCEQVCREALDRGRMPLAENGEGTPVTVFGSLDEDGITETLVDERPRGPRVLPDLTALATGRLHGANGRLHGAN